VVNGTTRLIGNVAINTTTAYKPLEVWSNANDFVSVGVKDLNYGEYSGIHFGYVESNSQYRKSAIVFQRTDYSIGDASGKIHFLNVPSFLSGTNASLAYARMTINNNGNVGINDTLPLSTLSVNGTLGVTGAATLSSTLAVTGNITEGGNNVLTNLDTASLSSRIDAKLSTSDTASLSNRINLKYNSSGGTISGAVTLSTTSATPTSLLGKDGSNVVGSVTTVAQTGLFGRGSVTNAVTDANGNITVAHGFNFTPIMAFANLPASTTNIVNVKEVDGTNITFIVRDGATNNVLNAQTVTKIEFFAIK
jgi:CRISPR-associated DxTHG motif protein